MATLGEFISFLDDYSLIDATTIQSDTHRGFINRIKLQKYVYFAQNLYNMTFDEGDQTYQYPYNAYRYGPYSPSLASDYYDINLPETVGMEYHLEIDEEDFLSRFNGTSEVWLEIAATLYDNLGLPQEELISLVNNMKPKYSVGAIKKVYDDMRVKELITANQ